MKRPDWPDETGLSDMGEILSVRTEYLELLEEYVAYIEADNKRLRQRIADWAKRMQWADGLDVCIEEMHDILTDDGHTVHPQGFNEEEAK